MGISYFDVWKKKMENNGGDITQSRLNDSKNFYNNNFKNDPSYKLATLKKKDINILDSDLDTRIVNVDTDVYKKKIYVRPDTNIEAGDYIIYPNKTYLVLSVEDNLVSPYASVEECNHLFKWITNEKYYEISAIVTNNTKYTLGVSSVSNSIIEGNGMFSVILSDNKMSSNIKIGQRFIVNGQAWEATQTDRTTTKGILSILLGESSINTNDDMENEIANAFEHSYTITLDSTSQSLVETSTYQIKPTVKDENKIVLNPNIIYTSSDETIATVNNGLVSALKVGSCNIIVSIGGVSVILSLVVTAKTTTPIVSYGHNFSQSETIKQYVTSIGDFTKTIDGVKTPLKISYSFDALGQSLIANKKIIVSQTGDNLLSIKNVLINTTNVVHLSIIDSISGEKILDNEPITFIKGI